MSDEELRQLVQSNARAIQAMLDARVEEREEHRENMAQLREGQIHLQEVCDRLTRVQEGVTNLLASIDEDRPTVLRKLTAIENKVDRLLERENENP